jgi:sirohydrochlorin ferrochelatase
MMAEKKTALLIMAHGSRITEANDAAREIAGMVREMTGYDIVEVAFRELHPPDIQEGIDACVAQGAERILLIPYFLFVGAHVRQDLPQELTEGMLRHPGVEMVMGPHLGVHRKLAEVVVERIAQGLTAAGWH